MEEKIAIVIPAYKCRFLRQTLDSIVVQTCRSFTVYIGDDASPQNLKEIVSDYADKMNIVYRRFDTNLGGFKKVATSTAVTARVSGGMNTA